MVTQAGKTIFETTARENPRAVLGVPAEADLRAAYRAYLEQVKKHRPGKDTGQFGRLTAAYRELRDVQRARDKAGAARLATPAAEQEAVTSLPDAVESRRAELHFALAHGQLRRATELLDALHATGSLGWAALRAEPDRRLAVWLFAEHVDRELLAGRAAELEALVTGSAFGADLAGHPGLELVAYRVLTVSARRDPTAALQFLLLHPPADGPDQEPERAEVLTQLSVAMSGGADVRQGVPAGSALERVLDVGFIAPPPGGALARALLAELGDDAQALHRLDALRAEAPAALARLTRIFEHWAPRDDRLWEELSAPEQSWTWSFTQELETALEKNWRNRVSGWSLLVLLVASGVVFQMHGLGYASLTAVAGFVAWTVVLTRGDRKLERTLLRPLFMARLVKTGVSPDRVLECMFHMKTGATDLGRFLDEIFLDEPLDALAALERVRSALAQRAHEPPCLRAPPP
jgi:hypothetical protein